MNVLYVSHTGQLGGAERSLLELIEALPDEVRVTVATPPGSLERALAHAGVATTPITGTASSLRLHPLHTARGAAQIAASAGQIRQAAAEHGAQVAHANSIRAGIMLALAPLRGVAKVVHVRDCLPPGVVTSLTMKLVTARSGALVANSRYTAQWVSATAPRARVEVVHNGIDTDRFAPDEHDRSATRAALDAGSPLLLGVVAQVTPWKGQSTAIEALALVRDQGLDAHLLLVGSVKFRDRATRFDNEQYLAQLRALVRDHGLQDHVSFLGEREDVPQLIRALDVLLVPSWEEPFGRSVLEAMASGVPVIATDVGGPAELLSDGTDGLLAPPRQPRAWALAIATLASDPGLSKAMASAALAHARQCFTASRHAARMLDVYARAAQRQSNTPQASLSRA
ncbi:MAG TPA: glycosyltransferase family 4 protein [Solirubrobacteraceae bacterium]|nr:glycosyltransferase family 4 protein [Solirubrobacteraceae bacterium]